MKSLLTFWQFTRPHTIIGSTLSIISLLVIGGYGFQLSGEVWLKLLLPSLIAAWGANIYITGLNQWADVEVDKINKPWLPIAAGNLTRRQGFTIVAISGALALIAAALYTWFFFLLILGIMAIGTAYSLPPLKFKRSHVLAAGAISLVRGLLVNVGFYLHFNHAFTKEWVLSPAIWPLTVFVIAFSLGIAWFKDIPDTEGDAAYSFGTLAVKLGRGPAFVAGVVVVSIAYISILLAAFIGWLPSNAVVWVGNGLALVAFWVMAWRLDVKNDQQVKRFYYFFWGLFFLEYILYPAGLYLG